MVYYCYIVWANERKRVIEFQERITPKIKLSFADDKYCILAVPLKFPMTGPKIGEAYYVRVLIENKGERTASYAAHLLNIQKEIDGKFVDTSYATRIQLGKDEILLPKNLKRHVNVFYLESGNPMIRLESSLYEHENICSEAGIYKFDVQVSDGDSSEQISLLLDWKGKFERPSVTIG